MKNTSLFSLLLTAGLAVLLLGSCKEDPPTADFIYTVDGLTVTFENDSENATSYSWDFGDGNTSTSESPSHTFAEEGTYTITLTAKGDGGEDTYSEDIFVSRPAVQINGNFDDWAEYDSYYLDETGGSGTLIEAKANAKNGFLFFYVRATADAGPVIQVFIDKDNNGATGWGFWGAYDAPGVDYLLEYAIETFTGQYGTTEPGSALFGADEEDWPWNITIAATGAVFESSGWVTVGNEKVIEFSVAQSLMPDLGSTVRMIFSNSNNDWEEAGTLPKSWVDPLNAPLPIEL
ncbi:MAG: PKD domain-containing protein [Saprospiraceae bacterium]